MSAKTVIVSPVQITYSGMHWTVIPNRPMTKQELIVFRQTLSDAEAEQSSRVNYRGPGGAAMWRDSDTYDFINSAMTEMSRYGLSFVHAGPLSEELNLDLNPEIPMPDNPGWSCDSCESVETPLGRFPCSACIKPAGRMFRTHEST